MSFAHYDEFSDVADHCTVCHKCASPCTGDIESGAVSHAIRYRTPRPGKRRFHPGTHAPIQLRHAPQPDTTQR